MVGRIVAAAIEAPAAPPPRSFLAWMLIDILGVRGLVIALAAVLAFALTLVLVRRGRGRLVGAALVLIVPLPFVVSLIGAMDAAAVTCAGLGSDLKLVDVADSIARAVFCPLMGMVCSSPAFIVAVWNSYWHSITVAHAET